MDVLLEVVTSDPIFPSFVEAFCSAGPPLAVPLFGLVSSKWRCLSSPVPVATIMNRLAYMPGQRFIAFWFFVNTDTEPGVVVDVNCEVSDGVGYAWIFGLRWWNSLPLLTVLSRTTFTGSPSMSSNAC